MDMKSRNTTRRLLLYFLLVLAVASLLGAVAWVIVQALPSTSNGSAAQISLAYARQTMSWSRGPDVSVSREVTLRQLDAALRRDVPASVRRDVNIPDLIRRFGASHRVELVILSGTYYSLPPDEGANINGKVVVLV